MKTTFTQVKSNSPVGAGAVSIIHFLVAFRTVINEQRQIEQGALEQERYALVRSGDQMPFLETL
jgi:hypothetical protein